MLEGFLGFFSLDFPWAQISLGASIHASWEFSDYEASILDTAIIYFVSVLSLDLKSYMVHSVDIDIF